MEIHMRESMTAKEMLESGREQTLESSGVASTRVAATYDEHSDERQLSEKIRERHNERTDGATDRPID